MTDKATEEAVAEARAMVAKRRGFGVSNASKRSRWAEALVTVADELEAAKVIMRARAAQPEGGNERAWLYLHEGRR